MVTIIRRTYHQSRNKDLNMAESEFNLNKIKSRDEGRSIATESSRWEPPLHRRDLGHTGINFNKIISPEHPDNPDILSCQLNLLP